MQPPKAITLMAMSGVGKTHLAGMLAGWGWEHYSCDYLIGAKYLKSEIKGTVTPEDLSALSAYVGQIGKGALKLEEFKRRQAQYLSAECEALRGVGAAIKKAGKNFVNDSTGSLCEIEDEALLAQLAKETLFVYIKTGLDEEKELLARAQAYPKPLYFPPAKFDEWLGHYLKEKNLKVAGDITPDDFSRWVFPRLFHSRIPKYERLAKQYGVTIPSAALKDIKSEADFLEVIEDVQKNR